MTYHDLIKRITEAPEGEILAALHKNKLYMEAESLDEIDFETSIADLRAVWGTLFLINSKLGYPAWLDIPTQDILDFHKEIIQKKTANKTYQLSQREQVFINVLGKTGPGNPRLFEYIYRLQNAQKAAA